MGNMINKYTRKATTILMILVMMLSAVMPSVSDVSYAAVRRPSKVAGLKLKANKNKITIKWRKAKRAKKYQVYVKRNSGTWKRIKTLRKTSVTYKAKKNGKFSFRMRALNGKNRGKLSKVKKVRISCINNRKYLAIDCGDTITATAGDEISIKAKGKDVTEWTEWKYPRKIFLCDGPDYGDTFKRDTLAAGKGIITVKTESGRTASVSIIVKERPSAPRREIDGVEFNDYTDYFGRTYDSTKDDEGDGSAGILSQFPDTYAVFSKFFDIKKVSVKVDYDGEKKYVTYNTVVHDTDNVQNYPKAYSGAYIKNVGSILLESSNFSTYSDYSGHNDFNWEGQIYVKFGSFCKTAKKARVRIYYGDELLDDYYWVINPKERNKTVEYFKQQTWVDGMTNYEKLEAVAKYIADNYKYSNDTDQGYDCHSCWMIQDIASKDLGLYSYTIHESGYGNASDMTGKISLSGGCGGWGHLAAVVEIDSKLYVFHTQGGSYSIEELERVEPDDGYWHAYFYYTYNGKTFRLKNSGQYGNVQFSETC